MAGIGFELKKLFAKKGFLATLRAYGYAGVVSAGPMILGFLLILSTILLTQFAGLGEDRREVLVSMLTYTLLASLTLTSLFSMLTTRFTADMIFEKKMNKVIPSFYGSISVMLGIGVPLYGLFIFFALHEERQQWPYAVLCTLLFAVLIVVWTEINYLTAIKDYRNIMLAFAVCLVIGFLSAAAMIFLLRWNIIISALLAVLLCYSIMAVWYFLLIYRYFPEGFGTGMRFFQWADNFPQLSLIGFFINAGLFFHIIIMWYFSPAGKKVTGWLYGAPGYDVPAILAYFCILISTVSFVTSVETRFYPLYRDYFSLFNEGGNIEDIESVEKNMNTVLFSELNYLAIKQLISTLLFIIIGSIVIPRLPLGFNTEMLGVFRVLCVAYGLYAIGNSIMLIILYFTDLTGALKAAALFMGLSLVCTYVTTRFSSAFYGFGFLIAGAVFSLYAYFRLTRFLRKIKYNVLCRQPIYAVEKHGVFTRFANFMELRASKIENARRERYEKKHADLVRADQEREETL